MFQFERYKLLYTTESSFKLFFICCIERLTIFQVSSMYFNTSEKQQDRETYFQFLSFLF